MSLVFLALKAVLLSVLVSFNEERSLMPRSPMADRPDVLASLLGFMTAVEAAANQIPPQTHYSETIAAAPGMQPPLQSVCEYCISRLTDDECADLHGILKKMWKALER